MKRENISNKILEEMYSIESIIPSENWDLNFMNKLNAVTKSKSHKLSKFNIAIVVLIFVNIGFIFNSFATKDSSSSDAKASKFNAVADELLISNN
jgi:hypothetical protein